MRGEVDAAPIYDDAGVDVSLVCWMLSLSPAERLEALESFTEDIMILRDAAKAP